MRHRQVLLFAVIALGTTVSGCRRGNDLDLQAVSGSVTLDSRLLDSGTMRFVPMAKNGLLGGATIAAGQYRIPKEKGLPPGKYAVQISAAQPSAGGGPAQPGPPGLGGTGPLKEAVPEQYNSKSQLTIEVKPDGGNTFNFDLSSRAEK